MKTRKVDVTGVEITYQAGDTEELSFEQILDIINSKTSVVKIKDITCELMSTELENCIIGIIKTSQNKEVPPLVNLNSKSMRGIDRKNGEGLGFANIFLYDTKLKILIYEVNKDGCYHNDLKVFIHNVLLKEDKNPININFPIITRKEDITASVARMERITKLKAKIFTPSDLKQEIEENNISTDEGLMDIIDNPSGATTIIKEYIAANKKISPLGLKRSFIDPILKSLNKLIKKRDLAQHFDDLIIEGYTLNEEKKSTKRIIDYFENTYRETFKITKKTLHLNLQEGERKDGIISVYNKIKDGLYADYLAS